MDTTSISSWPRGVRRTAVSPTARQTTLMPVETAEARIIQLQKSAIVVDAREASVYALGHVPGALSLPEPDFNHAFTRLEKQLPREARIMVYCESETCDQAESVCWSLIGKGYNNVWIFKKGWSAWETAGYPQETGAAR